MLRKLRRRFLYITMILVFVVLFILIMIINIVNRVNTNDTADEIISVIVENVENQPLNSSNSDPDIDSSYSTKYFYMLFEKDSDEDEETFYAFSSTISDIDYEEADELVSRTRERANARKRFRSKGYTDKYRYGIEDVLVLPDYNPGVVNQAVPCTIYLLLDMTNELSSWNFFLWISVIISILVYVLIYIVVYFISKRVVNPIVESYEKQQRFITDAGHDLKTPLAIINANTEVLELTEGENEWTVGIKNQVTRLTSLTDKLIYLAKMDEKEERHNFSKFNASECVADCCEEFIALSQVSGKKLEINIKPDLIYSGDESSINQLVTLLLDNAFKYSDDGGTISISLTGNSEKYLTLIVSNSVEYIKPGRHDEFFNRFYRADDSRNSQTGGQGIGLSVVQAIVSLHRGRVRCESPNTKSIQFIISL
ncbi:MAG: HAMP domain-containing histidine kinase [Clostridia bacterium]|nr:HAMP domain-containing histidine kinase [Clostridia bacterium]